MRKVISAMAIAALLAGGAAASAQTSGKQDASNAGSEAKQAGKSVKETKTKKLAPVIDLMAALQKSLNQAGTEKKPATRTHTSEGGKKRRAAGG